MRGQDTGQLEVRGGLFFSFFFRKRALEYTEQWLHEDEEGARVFPVNNILL